MASIVNDYPELTKHLEEIHSILMTARYDTPVHINGVLLSDYNLKRLVDTIRNYTHTWEGILSDQAWEAAMQSDKVRFELIMLPTAMKKKGK